MGVEEGGGVDGEGKEGVDVEPCSCCCESGGRNRNKHLAGK